jgi:hypothetical protein
MANLNISDALMAELQAIVSGSKEFTDVSAYAGYILEQVVAKKKQASHTGQAAAEPMAKYSKEDEDKIRERLKNLGYLD